MADEVVRNIQIKLDVSEDDQHVLDETFEQFRAAAQHVSDYGWNSDPDNLIKAKNQLHTATYADVRDTTTLQASLVQSARNLAANALSNCKDLLDDDKTTSKPEFKGTVIVYNGRTITYNDDHVTLATVDDRVHADYVFPHQHQGTPFEEYWTDEWDKKEATFHIMNGAFYGAGSTRLSMVLGVGTLWGMRITIAIGLVAIVGFGATGVWYGIALSNVIAAISGGVFFIRGRWSENVLEDDQTRIADAD